MVKVILTQIFIELNKFYYLKRRMKINIELKNLKNRTQK